MDTAFGSMIPPDNIDQDLYEYLVTVFNTIDEELSTAIVVKEINQMPTKFADGDVYYATIAISGLTGSPGFFGRVNGAWQKL